MPYFGDWFGPVTGDDYMEDWFDPDGGPPPAASGFGGISRPRLLGTVNSRPVVPIWRQIDGPTGAALTDIRRFLSDVLDKEQNWGNHVDVVFTAADTPTRIVTGLGGPHKGYRIDGLSAALSVFNATPPTPVPERGVMWLQASAPGTVKLYVY